MNGVISGHGHPGHRSIAESLERSADRCEANPVGGLRDLDHACRDRG